MKTLNVNVVTPTQNEINEMMEMFSSMAEAMKSWDDEAKLLITDNLLDLNAKAVKAPMGWDALIPNMEIYDTITTDLHAKFDEVDQVAVMTTVVKPEWYETIVSIIPDLYIDHGVAVLDPVNCAIVTRFNNADTEPFNDVKNGIKFNFVKVA